MLYIVSFSSDGWPSGVRDGNNISLFDIVFCLNLKTIQTGRFDFVAFLFQNHTALWRDFYIIESSKYRWLSMAFKKRDNKDVS